MLEGFFEKLNEAFDELPKGIEAFFKKQEEAFKEVEKGLGTITVEVTTVVRRNGVVVRTEKKTVTEKMSKG